MSIPTARDGTDWVLVDLTKAEWIREAEIGHV